MGKYKICVYAICKNEEKFVQRWVDAVKEADLIVVADTGSTDDSVKKLRELGVMVYEEKIEPFRFDTARNLALSHIPEDADICVSNDIDEVFDKGWREKLENAWKPEHTRARYMFTWSHHSDGTPDKQFVMEKIHRRHGFRWIHPVHEILEYYGEDKDEYLDIYSINLNHYPDLTKSRGQYLTLLEQSVKENPNDDRSVFWLGREYMYHENYEKAICTLQKYLKMDSAVWDEERSAGMRFLSNCYKALKNMKEAKRWALRAIAECSYIREPYLWMSKLAYEWNDWDLLYYFSKKGLEINFKTGSYLEEPECYSFLLEDFAAIACFYLGLVEKSLEHSNKACNLAPDDERLQNNRKIVLERLSNERKERENGKI